MINPTEKDVLSELSKMKGGGGTCFRTAYKYLEEKQKKADVIIHLTDGEGTFPATFTRPLIICLQARGRDLETVKKSCPYATVVKITEE